MIFLSTEKAEDKMNISVSLILSIFLAFVYAVTALREGDCEGKSFYVIYLYVWIYMINVMILCSLFVYIFIVCVAVVDKFSQTLTPDIKNDPKKIEDKFREFCKSTKSKENRFVSLYIHIRLYG